MWPWAHAASGYLLYRGWIAARGVTICGTAVVVLVLGTVLPDLIDKPLAWTLGILTSGRSLGHSLVVTGLVFGILWSLIEDSRRRNLLRFGTAGVLIHILGDATPLLIANEWHEIGFLVWPILRATEPDEMASFLEHFLAISPTPFFIVQTILTLAAILLWFQDDRPGLDAILRLLGRDP